MIVIAAVFISLGTGDRFLPRHWMSEQLTWTPSCHLGHQLFLVLAKNKWMVTTTDWRSIERLLELILMSRGLEYNLPVKLDGVKPESQQILLEYLNEHKWELRISTGYYI